MTVIGALRDGWRRLRNRLLADPRFQAAAAAFPPTRPIARKRSRQLFDLLAGFTYSQVLYAVVKLGLVDLLNGKAMTAAEIAAAIGWPPDRTARLLRAAAALDLVEQASTGTFMLGIHGAALAGNGWIGKFIEHHHLLYADLADPLPILRGDAAGTALHDYWAYAGDTPKDRIARADAAAYTALMAASQQAVAAEILAACDFSSCRRLLDVGGSNGTFITAAAARYPGLAFTLFDLPAVAGIARDRLRDAGLSGRVDIAEGSFLTDPLPQGADVATLIRVAHDHDDDSVLAILRAIRAALPPGGRLFVAEPLSGNASTAAVADVYFGLYFMAMGQGRTRTAAEIGELGLKAGFAAYREVKTRMPLITGVVALNASRE